uniref:Putative secreted protein n=1 Tax=Anopheles marajoara TaxID=58244 RepID=A0A2M4CFC1_9DIPT
MRPSFVLFFVASRCVVVTTCLPYRRYWSDTSSSVCSGASFCTYHIAPSPSGCCRSFSESRLIQSCAS